MMQFCNCFVIALVMVDLAMEFAYGIDLYIFAQEIDPHGRLVDIKAASIAFGAPKALEKV